MSYSELSSGIVGKWYTGRQFVSSGKVNILLEQPQRAPQVTISEPKGKTEANIFLGTYFFFLLKIP